MSVSSLISLFGTQERLAQVAEVAGQSTVSGWKKTGSIPWRKRVTIIRNAPNFGVTRAEAFKVIAAELIEAAGVKL